MNYAIILSGGVGNRMGLDIPKQYYKVANKPIIQYVIETIAQHAMIDGYVVVAEEAWQEFVGEQIDDMSKGKFLGFAKPGRNRQLSIYQGLLALQESTLMNEEDLVLVQDAARPNTSADLMTRCLSIGMDKDGAMPVLPMKDTVYLSYAGQQVDELLKREQVFAGQAPEVFRYGKYLAANQVLLPEKILTVNGSTEPAIMSGLKIALLEGEESNFKITTVADLKRFEQLVEERSK